MDGFDQTQQMGPGQNPGEDKPHRHRHSELVADEEDHDREAEDNYEIG